MKCTAEKAAGSHLEKNKCPYSALTSTPWVKQECALTLLHVGKNAPPFKERKDATINKHPCLPFIYFYKIF